MIRSILASLLVVGSAYAQLFDIIVPAPGQMTPSLDGNTFENCMPITPFFNLHWQIVGNDIVMVHEGSSDMVATEYFAFAVVADQNAPNRMAGADTAITSFLGPDAQAIDYLMNAVAGCDTDLGVGVCPDAISGRGLANADPTQNSIVDVEGFMQDGIHVVRYTRPLAAADATDLPIDINNEINYIFARGPVQPGNGLAGFHMDTRTAVAINFGRIPSFDCIQLAPQVGGETTTRMPLTTTTVNPDGGDPTMMPVGPDSGASAAKPEYLLAALVMGAALL